MGNINSDMFSALGAQGFTGSISDRLLAYYRANGASSRNIDDALREMLIAQGATPAHVNDMWYQVLGGLGFTGSLNDRLSAFWADGGSFGPSVIQVAAFSFTDGIPEAYDMSSSPYAAINAFDNYPGSSSYGMSYSPATDKLAVSDSTNIYIFDTTVLPFALEQTLAEPFLTSVLFSPDGSKLYAYASSVNQTVIFNTSNWTSQNVYNGPVSDTDFTADSNGLYIANDAGGSPHVMYWDVTGVPALGPAIIGETTLYDAATVHKIHNYGLAHNTSTNRNIYAIDLDTFGFVGAPVTGTTMRGMKLRDDGARLVTLEATGGNSFLVVRNSTDSVVTNWPLLPIAGGNEFSTPNFPESKHGLKFSANGRYLILWRLGTGDQRVIYDLDASPIVRATSFDVGPSRTTYRDAAIIGFNS